MSYADNLVLGNLANINVTFIYSVTICKQKTIYMFSYQSIYTLINYLFFYLSIYLSVNVIFSHTEKDNKTKKKKQTRSSEPEFHLRRGQERPGPRGGKYPSFTFLSFEFQSRVLVLSILYYIYIQGNPAHVLKRAGECLKCFLKAFRTSRSRSWNKTESYTETVKFLSEKLSIYVRSSQQEF